VRAGLVERGRWIEELGRRLVVAAEAGDTGAVQRLGDQVAAVGLRLVAEAERFAPP
jgi:hypothetical protein